MDPSFYFLYIFFIFHNTIAHAIHEITCTCLINVVYIFSLNNKSKWKLIFTKYLSASLSSCMVCELGGITLCTKRAKQKAIKKSTSGFYLLASEKTWKEPKHIKLERSFQGMEKNWFDSVVSLSSISLHIYFIHQRLKNRFSHFHYWLIVVFIFLYV